MYYVLDFPVFIDETVIYPLRRISQNSVTSIILAFAKIAHLYLSKSPLNYLINRFRTHTAACLQFRLGWQVMRT